MIRVSIFGSTGSIGQSALEVIRRNRDRFSVSVLVAGKNDAQLLRDIREFRPSYVGLSDAEARLRLTKALGKEVSDLEIVGESEIASLASVAEVDCALMAIVGLQGLKPVIEAVRAKKRVALANKESLVAGGALVTRLVQEHGATLVPVDSEHSAIFQLLQGKGTGDVRRLWLTASGGPFLDRSLDDLQNVTPAEAIKHPRWAMGPKISVDSATLMNKALELIEAHWLFGLAASSIQIVIHPQSIIHGLVEFHDGTQYAHASVPDMKAAIAFALNYPNGRLRDVISPLNLGELGNLNFRPIDDARFQAISLARQALTAGLGAVFNSANEEAVARFLAGKISFIDIVPTVAEALETFENRQAGDYEEILAVDEEVRMWVRTR